MSEAGEKKEDNEEEVKKKEEEKEAEEEAEFENWSPCVVRIAILSSTLDNIIFTENPSGYFRTHL